MGYIIKPLLKYFILLIICIYIKSVESIQPIPLEYICLKNFVLKFSLNTKFPLNKTGEIENFCDNTTGVLCNIDGSIASVSFNSEVKTSPSTQVDYTDFSCLPSLLNINLIGFNITNDLLYKKLTNVSSISFKTSSVSSLTNVIPYDTCTLTFDNLVGVLKMSYLNLQSYTTIVASIIGITIEVDEIALVKPDRFLLISNALNIPNLTSLTFSSLTIITTTGWNYSSTVNIPSIQAISIFLNLAQSYPSQFPQFDISTQKIFIGGDFIQPTEPIDLTYLTKLSYFEFQDSGLSFHINNELPFKVSPMTTLSFKNGNITKIPIGSTSFMNFSSTASYTISQSTLSGNLPPFTGVEPLFYSFSHNKISGTLDSSWCFAKIEVLGNIMTGALPSCITCHLNSSDVSSRFYDNLFSNFNPVPICTTFAPRIDYNASDNSLVLTGNDIGDGNLLWSQDSTLECSLGGWTKVLYGRKYVCTLQNQIDQIKYFWVEFPTPGVNYTFPLLLNQLPIPTSIVLQTIPDLIVTMSGTFFSTYIGYSAQSFTFNGVLCSVISSNFFQVVCKLNDASVLGGNSIEAQFNVNGLKRVVLVNLKDGFDNNILCSSDCSGVTKGLCNMATGKCVCLKDVWSGEECSIPYHYITSVSSSTINGGNASFIGVFGNVHTDLSITIDGKNCLITFNSSTEIRCIAPPTDTPGLKPMIIFQNGIEFKYSYQYFDIIEICPLNCSKNGKCNTANGQCQCNTGFISYDCSIISINNTETQQPVTNTTIDPNTGGTEITNQEIQFSIYFKSLFEIDINGNTIKEYPLQNNWKLNTTVVEPNQPQVYTFMQIIQSGCTIKTEIEEILNENGKQFQFANSSFKLEKGAIKFSISISNYTYLNNLNTLKLVMISMVKENDNSYDNQCNEKDTEINNLQDPSTFNYIKISKNNKILAGRFISKLLSDGNPTYLNTVLSKEEVEGEYSILVSLDLPHCTISCEIDPDFSVLVDPSFKSSCFKESNRKWVIPVAVVVSFVGATIIIILLFFLYKKHNLNIHIRVGMAQLKNLNK